MASFALSWSLAPPISVRQSWLPGTCPGQDLCSTWTVFNLSPMQNLCLYTDDNKTSVGVIDSDPFPPTPISPDGPGACLARSPRGSDPARAPMDSAATRRAEGALLPAVDGGPEERTASAPAPAALSGAGAGQEGPGLPAGGCTFSTFCWLHLPLPADSGAGGGADAARPRLTVLRPHFDLQAGRPPFCRFEELTRILCRCCRPCGARPTDPPAGPMASVSRLAPKDVAAVRHRCLVTSVSACSGQCLRRHRSRRS